ncbi:MAG: hypothetical protein LKJ25_10965 [Clostridia bacterium]|jgi:uncharacterized ferredoxin-like protein|nr:hypothetical protein [Clostridia bacterium]
MFLRGMQAEKNHVFTVAEKICTAVKKTEYMFSKYKISSAIVTNDDKEKIAVTMSENNLCVGFSNVKYESDMLSRCDIAILIGISNTNEIQAENIEELKKDELYTALGMTTGIAAAISDEEHIFSAVSLCAGETALKMEMLGDKTEKIIAVLLFKKAPKYMGQLS